MAAVDTKTLSATTSAFDIGSIPTKVVTADPKRGDPRSPPKPLEIVTPTIAGTFPVVFFFHGFYLRNYFYSDVLVHIASHGFILVAPQLCKLLPPGGQQEVDDAGKVINWVSGNLQALLPGAVKPSKKDIALAGHSRGGKTAFAVALGKTSKDIKIDPSIEFSALIGIDPVAGPNRWMRTDPKILTDKPESLELDMPVTVIGTGLGPLWKTRPLMPPCAPSGVNHQQFYCECKPTKAHFVAADYGHMDMLDDDLPGFVGYMAGCMCRNGKLEKSEMRRFVGGIVVASLRYSLFGERSELRGIVKDPSASPARIDPPPELDEA